MENVTITKLFYNGTGLECFLPRYEMEQKTKKAIEEQLQTYTLAEIKAGCLKDLNELEADLFAHFQDEIDMKDAMKHWGKKSNENFCRWCYGIVTLLKLKVLKNDDNNGWWEMTLPTELLKTMNIGRMVNIKKLFHTCECCGNKGTLKKCSTCKKVYYCDAKCQKLHWKTHKSNCC